MGNTLIESENQMRNCIVLVSLFCFHVSAVARPVKTIFDTDMELDVDDVGALAMLRASTHGYFHILEGGTHMWRINPNNPHHHIMGEFAEGIDALNVASDFDRYMAQSNDK